MDILSALIVLGFLWLIYSTIFTGWPFGRSTRSGRCCDRRRCHCHDRRSWF